MNIDFSKIQFGIAQLWMFIFKIFWDQNIYFMRINIRKFGIVIYSRINVPMNVCQHLSTLTEEIPLNMLILQIQWSRNFFLNQQNSNSLPSTIVVILRYSFTNPKY